MVIMLAAGIHSDLKVRRVLRERLADEMRRERDLFMDEDQEELFDGSKEEAEST
jgi:hypothetical protein